MLIVTKRKKMGYVAGCFVYSVAEVDYLTIPNRVWRETATTVASTLDARYKELVQLSEFADCYFSYTFDLTRTVQYNYGTSAARTRGSDADPGGADGWHDRFVWNRYLLDPWLSTGVSLRWVLPIIHGYFQQAVCHVADKPISIALIGRRSRHFAGVRYLKRGITDDGNVANEVEVEQVVQSMALGQVNAGECTSSFTQLRGSIPLYWGQDSHSMAPKPPINIIRTDPFYNSTVLHFANLFERYGSPLLVLNLVKSIEKVPRETILKEEYERCIMLLNESLDADNRIIYIPWDFLRAQKQKFDDPVALLDAIAEAVLAKTGIFMCCLVGPESSAQPPHQQQSGTVRTNCVDSLDRTNAGQFCVGKAALGHQLAALGVVAEGVALDEEVHTLLMGMYEELGNHISMQYGGSELAHTMKNFESKTWASSVRDSSRELLTGMKRYYSNSFTDQEKQASMNLVLGVYVPMRELEDLWTLETDYLLHNRISPPPFPLVFASDEWWREPLRRFEARLAAAAAAVAATQRRAGHERRQAFATYYSQTKLTSFDKLLRNSAYVLPASAKADADPAASLVRRVAPLAAPRTPLRKSMTTPAASSATAAAAAPPDQAAAEAAAEERLARRRLASCYHAYLTSGPALASRSCVPPASVAFYTERVARVGAAPLVPAASREVYSACVGAAHPAVACGPVYPDAGSSGWRQGPDEADYLQS